MFSWQQPQHRGGPAIHEGSQEGYGLDGFAKPHFICQNDMLPLLPGKVEPVEAFQLVGVQAATPLQEAGAVAELTSAYLASRS